jgi:nucleotide-binding universal stress UspA family protein
VAAVDDVEQAPSANEHPALLLASRLARPLGARLEIFHADLGSVAVSPEVRAATEGLGHGLAARAVLAPLSEAPGHPARLLAAHLDDLDRDAGQPDAGLAVMGSHGRGPLAATLLGTTTGDFLSNSGRPAVVAGPAYRPDLAPTRVVCCLDGSTRAESMLDAATGWAKALDVPLWLVRAVAELPPLAWGDERSYLDRVAAKLAERGIPAEREIVGEQRPSVGLVTWLNERPGTMGVLATHGTTGLAAVALGGTAGAVVRHAHGPVLLRRPGDLLP